MSFNPRYKKMQPLNTYMYTPHSPTPPNTQKYTVPPPPPPPDMDVTQVKNIDKKNMYT